MYEAMVEATATSGGVFGHGCTSVPAPGHASPDRRWAHYLAASGN